MQYTTHFNLNLPEGTDVVNPLVQDNPNYTAIDDAMFANKQAVIGTASELTAGTAHAITRSNTDSDYFRYTATSNWTSGDTMTVDGTTVSVYMSDGSAPTTGAYVINTEVLAFLNGTRVTLITSKSNTAPASDITYDNSVSGLNAINVQDAIDELSDEKVDKTELINTASVMNIPICGTGTASLAVNGNWLDVTFPVKKDSRIIWSLQSSANTGAFTVSTNGSVHGAYTNHAANHSDFNTLNKVIDIIASADEYIHITSYTNTATTFSFANISVAIPD